jgi:hypothetical protein
MKPPCRREIQKNSQCRHGLQSDHETPTPQPAKCTRKINKCNNEWLNKNRVWTSIKLHVYTREYLLGLSKWEGTQNEMIAISNKTGIWIFPNNYEQLKQFRIEETEIK